MLPVWADVLILLALPVLVLAAVWIWGDDEADNTVIRQQENEARDEDPDLMTAVA